MEVLEALVFTKDQFFLKMFTKIVVYLKSSQFNQKIWIQSQNAKALA